MILVQNAVQPVANVTALYRACLFGSLLTQPFLDMLCTVSFLCVVYEYVLYYVHVYVYVLGSFGSLAS